MVRSALVLLLVPLLCCQIGCKKKNSSTSSVDSPAILISHSIIASSNVKQDPALAVGPGPATPPAGPIADFYTLFNNKRVADGAAGGAIPWDPILAGVAQGQLDDLLNTGRFALLDDVTSASFPKRAASSGSTFNQTVFGIAKGYSNAQDLFDAILQTGDSDFTDALNNFISVQPTGIGVAYSTSRGGFWAFIIVD